MFLLKRVYYLKCIELYTTVKLFYDIKDFLYLSGHVYRKSCPTCLDKWISTVFYMGLKQLFVVVYETEWLE